MGRARLLRRGIVTAMLLAALTPALASSAWTQAETVAAASHAERTGIDIGPDGVALAWWWSPVPPDHQGPTLIATRASGSSGWSGASQLLGPGPGGGVGRFGRSLLYATPDRYPAGRGTPVTVLDHAGQVRASFEFDGHHDVEGAQFATSPSGRTVAVWRRDVPAKRRSRVMVARKLRGTRFKRPVAVSRFERAGSETAAVNDRGEVLVAWVVDDPVNYNFQLLKARLVRADGRLGPRVTLGRVRGFAFMSPSVAITAGGRGAVVWGAQNADGDQEGRPAYASEMRADGSFRKARRLTAKSAIGKSRYGYDIGRVQVVATPEGELVVAWTDGKPHYYAVRAATLRRGGLAAREALSAPMRDGQLLDLDAAPDGSVRALWSSDWDESGEQQEFFDQQEALDEESATPVELLAAKRPPGGSFGLSERLSSERDRRPIPDAALGFDSRTGAPVAVWIDGLDEQAELRSARGY